MITKEKEKGTSLYTREHIFEGWDEYIDECERRADWVLEERTMGAKTSSIHRREEDGGFSGCKTFDAAMGLARTGWPDGLELLMKMKQDLGVVFGSMVKRARMKNDWYGGTVSVARWLNDKPKIFRRRVTQFETGTGRVLDLSVDVSGSAFNSKEKLMRRGASILLLIDALESAGISCQLTVHDRTYGFRSSTYCVRVPIKKAGEQLDMDLLAFTLVHPARLRRLYFAMIGGEDDKFCVEGGFVCMNRDGGGYGSPLMENRNYKEESDVEIPHANEDEPWDDLHECADWVRENLKECGVKTEAESA